MNERLFLSLIKFSISLACIVCAASVGALSTDKNEDMEVEADTLYLDDTKNIGIYTGNVIVVQGSMRITGDKLTIYYTVANELEKIIVEGQPSTFRQLPDNSNVYDEAEALVMEYYENQNLIILTDKAKVNQGDRRLLADHIEYDTVLSQVRAKGGGAADNTNVDTRVRLIIPGNKASEDAPD